MKNILLIFMMVLVPVVMTGQNDDSAKGIKAGNLSSKLVAGAGLFSGYTMLTGGLHHYFNNAVPIGVSARVQYSIVVMEFEGCISFSQLRSDIPYDGGTWEQNSLVSMHFYEFMLGLDIGDKKHLSLCPFAGAGSTDFMRTQLFKDKDYEAGDGELAETFTWALGMNLDINISHHKPATDDNEGNLFQTYLRFGYKYTYPQFDNKYPGFGGNLQFFTIGLYLYGSASR